MSEVGSNAGLNLFRQDGAGYRPREPQRRAACDRPIRPGEPHRVRQDGRGRAPEVPAMAGLRYGGACCKIGARGQDREAHKLQEEVGCQGGEDGPERERTPYPPHGGARQQEHV